MMRPGFAGMLPTMAEVMGMDQLVRPGLPGRGDDAAFLRGILGMRLVLAVVLNDPYASGNNQE